MVFDLNKCMGCQSCSIACKMLWTREPGEEHQWWCSANTMPGRGTPRDWEKMGGGYRDGELVLGHEPTLPEFGGGWHFNKEEVFFGGKGSNEVEPGMVKRLHLVGDYGHLVYSPTEWQPVPFDRCINVDCAPCQDESCGGQEAHLRTGPGARWLDWQVLGIYGKMERMYELLMLRRLRIHHTLELQDARRSCGLRKPPANQ